MKILGVVLLGSVTTTFFACGGSTDPELTTQIQSAEDASYEANYTYFELRRDVRRCASPLCGGFFVKRTNRDRTRCADGITRAECYVADLDLSAMKLNANAASVIKSRAPFSLMRGSLHRATIGTFHDLGTLRVTEVWTGHEGSVMGPKHYRVKDSGIRCITYPCPSISASALNTSTPAKLLAGVNFDSITAGHEDALAQLSQEGLLISATPKAVSGPGGKGTELDATEYYLAVVPTADGSLACGSRALLSCASDEYCNYPPEANCGRGDAPGSCTLKTGICTLEYKPVCGCDGKTYGNACTAAGQGVSVDYTGECHTS